MRVPSTISLEDFVANKHYFEMNFIFSTYPEHPWLPEWSIEPRGCTATFREDNTHLFFKTGETVGRIIPHVDKPEWAFHIPVPQNSRTTILFNGFCAYFEKRKKRVGTEVLIPEPGVLWGRSEGTPQPVIASSLHIEQVAEGQWIESDNQPAFLLQKDNVFCLITKCHLLKDAHKLASTYLARDLELELNNELTKRSGATALFEEMTHHDSLAVICAESMMKSLRPPEGSIPMIWCQSSATSTPRFDINELHPLALAWKLIDIKTAEQLITCALKIQTNSGAIPVNYSPFATHSVLEAPKPFLAKTIEEVWNVRKDDELLTALLPPLRRHLQWMLHHFDPKRNGNHCWKSRGEPLVPNSYDTDLATVDLTVLLLTEIEAYNQLKQQSSAFASDPDLFAKEQATLKQNLQDQFWNAKEQAFTNGIQREKIVPQREFTAFTPLLYKNLSKHQQTAILDKVKEDGTLPGGLSVLSWRKNALDDNSFPLLQQLIVFEALRLTDANGQLLNDFSRITLQGFVEWHTLSVNERKQLHINPVLAAFIMNVQTARQYRYHAKGRTSGKAFKLFRKAKADRFDAIVVIATIFTVFSVHQIYTVRNAAPPLEMLQAQMNSAYADTNGAETLKNSLSIIHHYPEKADRARLLAANIFMIRDNFVEAEKLYQEARLGHPDTPALMLGLGLSQQLQGKRIAAEKNYYEFCYIFDVIFPDIVQRIQNHRFLLKEGFDTPPKWKEIYRYPMMHEL